MKVKVLIVRFSSIGDIVLTTPIIRCLKEQLEGDVEIHYLTKKNFSEILKHNSYLTKIHTIEKTSSEIIETLKKENFDYIVDLHNNIRSSYIKRNLKGISFTVNKINFAKWLIVNFKVDRLPKVHIVDRYFETFKALGVENDGKGLDYFISSNDEIELSISSGFVAFAIGGSYTTKKLPDEKIIKICKNLNMQVILLGGQEDIAIGNKIKTLVGDRIDNLCGELTINQSAWVISQADSVITHDTGMMHIAAAFKRPIVSIWGNTIPEFGMYPYLPTNAPPPTMIYVPDLNCRPCSKLGHSSCPKKHFNCMNLIDEQKVVEAIG